MTVQSLDPTTRKVTMTLAAIAATAATPRPSGETLSEQAARITLGVNAHLSDPPSRRAATGSCYGSG